jgi:hypothetical protein
MKNPVTLAVLLILLSALDFVQAAATAAQEDKRVEEEIRQLNAEEVNAFLHKDPQAMATAVVRRFCRHKSAEQARDQAASFGNGRFGLSRNHLF